MSAARSDRHAGQRLAALGGRRILREAELAPTNRERITRWRNAYARLRAAIRIATERMRTTP